VLLILLACLHPDRSASRERCADCHADTVTAWSTSLHAAAHSDPAFTEAFRRADDPWCLTCHLPDDGVTCATCHGDDGRTCADCHQFDLPGTTVASQDTVAEHARSSFADRPCTACHDPHAPQGGHDADALRRAIDVVATRTPDGTRFALTTTDVGHAFPTGDPFRRMVLEVCADLACRSIVAHHVLERSLVETDGTWRERADSRIPPPTSGRMSTVHLDLPHGRAWRLWYRLHDPNHPPLPSGSILLDTAPLEP
jgi:hypothetical protein